MRQIPDISQYEGYRVAEDVALEGTVIPGLTGRYYQRREGDRTATVGFYTYAGAPLFSAWGYQDEAHCAWTSYHDGGGWTPPHRGCPRIRFTADTAVIDTGSAQVTLPLGRPPGQRRGTTGGGEDGPVRRMPQVSGRLQTKGP